MVIRNVPPDFDGWRERVQIRIRLCMPHMPLNKNEGSERVNKAVETLGGQKRECSQEGMPRRDKVGMRPSDKD
jgi:hypothetical protein